MKYKILFLIFVIISLIGFSFTLEEGEETEIINENFENIGTLIGENLEIFVKGGIKISKEGDISTLEFNREDSSLNLDGVIYENIATGENTDAYIQLNEFGEIISADLTASDNTLFEFGEKKFELSKGQRIQYNSGETNLIGKSGEFFSYCEEDADLFKNIEFIGESINIKKNEEGNSIFTGEFNLGENKILGSSIIDKEGKILQINEGTNAFIGNINHQASRTLNFYYDENFNIENHKEENYFNYGDNKISLGGSGFTSDLGEENKAFGNMETEKLIGSTAKTRNLKITMNGGHLEIEKDFSNSDLGFNIKQQGDFIIENGRAVIYSQNNLYLKEKGLFVKSYSDKEGVLDCYDLNFDDGEYFLKDKIFVDREKDVTVNLNTLWEKDILKASKLSKEDPLVQEIEEKTKQKTGIRPRYLLGYMNEENEEEMLKWTYEATERANQNIYGVKISPEELWTMYMMEGGSNWRSGYPYYDYNEFGANADILGSNIGLDFIKEHQTELENGNFLPRGFLDQFSKDDYWTETEYYQQFNTVIFDNPKQSFIAFAAEIARRKHSFQEDFISAFGEEEFKKLSDEEAYYWLRRYFNTGEAAGKAHLLGTEYHSYNYNGEPIIVQGAGRENTYVPWDINRAEPTSSRESAHYNSMVATSTYIFMKALGFFSFP